MINWYPGHMAKAARQIAELAGQIDVVIEIADARAPLFSRCKVIAELRNKPHLLLLNKSDLAKEEELAEFVKNNENSVPISCIGGKVSNREKIINKINELAKDKLQRNLEKGMNKPLKLLVIGIPNVGKSAFINAFAKRGTLTVGNRPGVTRTPQWLRIDKYELLDTPGVLSPKLESERAGLILTWIGCIKDEIVDIVEVASYLCAWLESSEDAAFGYEKLLEFGQKRGCLIAGGDVDELRAAKLILSDFRSGKLGRIFI